MVKRPANMGAFEFTVLCGLRAAQLSRGCIALVPAGGHKLITTAQMEVAESKVVRESPSITPAEWPSLGILVPML